MLAIGAYQSGVLQDYWPRLSMGTEVDSSSLHSACQHHQNPQDESPTVASWSKATSSFRGCTRGYIDLYPALSGLLSSCLHILFSHGETLRWQMYGMLLSRSVWLSQSVLCLLDHYSGEYMSVFINGRCELFTLAGEDIFRKPLHQVCRCSGRSLGLMYVSN